MVIFPKLTYAYIKCCSLLSKPNYVCSRGFVTLLQNFKFKSQKKNGQTFYICLTKIEEMITKKQRSGATRHK